MKFINKFIAFILLFSLVLSCARRGNPSGGPKDLDAPITIKTIPAFKTVHFNKNEISIYFDEYIKLKDLNKNLIISPPFKYPADITPLGTPSKKITIKIKDTLLENTTYTLNFGESIIDNNEGNILKAFKYVFSTGDHIDSLSIKGSIKDALSKEVPKYVSVLLYEENETFNDSTIYKEKPIYVTNTLDSIGWEINNIKKGIYHLIALKDENNDFLFNPQTDKIAFLDTVIKIPTEKNITLNLFSEVVDFKLHKPIEESKNHLIFPFQGKGTDLEVAVNVNKSALEVIEEVQFFEKDKDTLHYYFKLPNNKVDSLFFNVKNDRFTSEEIVYLRKKVIDSLTITTNPRGTLHFNDTVKLTLNNPLTQFKKELITIFNKDTLAVDFKLQQNGYRDLLILFNKKESDNYKITILPKAITDYFNQNNKDTIRFVLRTKKKDNYGSIKLKINHSNQPIIVQLLSTKEVVIAQKSIIDNKNNVTFDLLKPANYLVRIILDDDENSLWNTGNYLLKQQPEKVIYFVKEIEVKENWFVNEVIDIK